MNFTDSQKLYFNVFLLFIITFFLASKVITGLKTNDVDYIKIGINMLAIAITIRNIIIINKKINS
jgi:hypothetical protein